MSGGRPGARRRPERGLPGVAAEDPRSYDLPDFLTLGDGPYPPILLEAFERAGNGFRLHLAGGGRRVGGGQQVAHAVLPADAVEEHVSRGVHAEVAGEDLAVVGEQVLG